MIGVPPPAHFGLMRPLGCDKCQHMTYRDRDLYVCTANVGCMAKRITDKPSFSEFIGAKDAK